MDPEGYGQRIWCSKSGVCLLGKHEQAPSSESDLESDNHSDTITASSEEIAPVPCAVADCSKSRSKLSSEQRMQIWQKHLSAPKLTQMKLAEWATAEFGLDKLTQATISKVLADFPRKSAKGGNLTNEQVVMVIAKSKEKGMTQQKLRHWTKKEFNLKNLPSQSTISNILNNKRGVPDRLSDNTRDLKRKRILKSPDLDNALAEWIIQRQENRVILTWNLVQAKARDFADQLKLPEDQRPSFSDGWLQKFLDRHGLRTVVMSGESGSADVAAINTALPELRAVIKEYAPQNVFNMDETGLFYCLAPDRTIATRQLEGMKKDKARISIALCANSDGTEKDELLFIGHAAKPRAFNKKSGKELGFFYRNNKKAWMTSLIFQEWLQLFDSRMKRQNRRVLLLLDNAPTHGVKNVALSNVTVLFLPPNTTSRIQPMDAGIIAAFKKRYRSFHLSHAIDRDAVGEKDIYKVDILKAMRWCRSSWSAVTASTIANCWRHTGLLSGPVSIQNDFDHDLDDELLKSVEQLKIASAFTFDEIAAEEAAQDIHHKFSDAELVELFAESEEDEPEFENDVGVDEGPTLDDKIASVKTTLGLLVDDPLENEAAIRQCRRILMELVQIRSVNRTVSLKQIDIRSFFKNKPTMF